MASSRACHPAYADQTSCAAPWRVLDLSVLTGKIWTVTSCVVPVAGGGNVRRKQAAEAAMPADERSKEAMRRAALQTQTAARDKPTATARQVTYVLSTVPVLAALSRSPFIASGFGYGLVLQCPSETGSAFARVSTSRCRALQKSVEESSRLFEEAFCGHCAMYLAAPHRLKECGHVFCGTCLDDCLANSTACPTCG